MNNDFPAKPIKYLTPLFGILCGVAISVCFFCLLLGVSALGGMGFSPVLTIPILAVASIYSFRSWLSLLHKNKLFGWGTFVGFLAGIVVIGCLILLVLPVVISPA